MLVGVWIITSIYCCVLSYIRFPNTSLLVRVPFRSAVFGCIQWPIQYRDIFAIKWCIGNDTGIHVVNKVTFPLKKQTKQSSVKSKCSDLAMVKKQTLMFT